MTYYIGNCFRNIERENSHKAPYTLHEWGERVSSDNSESLNPSTFLPAIVIVFLITSSAVVLSGLGRSSAEPFGTMTKELYLGGNGANAVEFGTGQVQVIWPLVESGLPGADIALDDAGNLCTCLPEYPILVRDPSMNVLVDMGPVSGVGAIDEVPSAGWTQASACVVGHGYVVSTEDGIYYSLYVEEAIEDPSGEPIGYVFKYAEIL